MTTAAALLTDLAARGITVSAAGDRLRFHPRAALSADDLARLREQKGELLALLAGGSVIDAARGDGPQDSAAALDPSGWTCPACGSARIAHGLRRLWCLDCETDAGPAGDPQDGNEGDAADWLERIDGDGRRTWQRADFDGLEVIDFPEPCAVCGGVDRWQDLVGGWHCAKCEPRTTGPRLRELARRLRTRYGMTEPDQDAAADAHGQNIHAPERSAPGGSGTAVPDAILRDSPTRCGDCEREVIPGQPGRAAGLCFDCWAKQKGR